MMIYRNLAAALLVTTLLLTPAALATQALAETARPGIRLPGARTGAGRGLRGNFASRIAAFPQRPHDGLLFDDRRDIAVGVPNDAPIPVGVTQIRGDDGRGIRAGLVVINEGHDRSLLTAMAQQTKTVTLTTNAYEQNTPSVEVRCAIASSRVRCCT